MSSSFDELSVWADELMAGGDPGGELLAHLLRVDDGRVPEDLARSSAARSSELELGVEGGRATTLSFVDRDARLGPRFVALAAQLVRLPASRRLRTLRLDAADCARNVAVLRALGSDEVQARPQVLVVGPMPREVRRWAHAQLAPVKSSWWCEPSSGVRSMFVCSDRPSAWRDGSTSVVRRVMLPWTERPRDEHGAAIQALAAELGAELAAAARAGVELSPELRTRVLRAIWDRDGHVRVQAAELLGSLAPDAELEAELAIPHSFRARSFGPIAGRGA